MKKQGGFEAYLAFMADWSAAALTPNGKILVADSRTDEDLKLIDDLFKRYTEISDAIDNLDLCLGFIKGRMPRKKGLKLDAYLSYHVTFYIQEIYILNERLESYAKTIMRRRKRLGEPVDVASYDLVLARVRAALSDIVRLRGSHVHDRAFSDDKMRGLSLYSFMVNHAPDAGKWSEHLKDEYADIKRYWVAKLGQNEIELKRLLDQYFEFIHSEVIAGSVAVLPSSRPSRELGAVPLLNT